MGGALATSGYEQYQKKYTKRQQAASHPAHQPVGQHQAPHVYRDPLEALRFGQQIPVAPPRKDKGGKPASSNPPAWKGWDVKLPVAHSDVERELILRRLGYQYSGWRSDPGFNTNLLPRSPSLELVQGRGRGDSQGKHNLDPTRGNKGNSPKTQGRGRETTKGSAGRAVLGAKEENQGGEVVEALQTSINNDGRLKQSHFQKHSVKQQGATTGRKIGLLKKQATVSEITCTLPSSYYSHQQEKCDVCTKSVYAAERQEAASRIYHKQCFKCSHCKCTLNLNNYSLLEGKLFCKVHYKAVTAEAGRIDRFKDVVDSGPKEVAD